MVRVPLPGTVAWKPGVTVSSMGAEGLVISTIRTCELVKPFTVTWSPPGAVNSSASWVAV